MTKTVLQQGAELGKRLGGRHGESAKEWAKRDPQAAKQMAEWMRANHKALVSAIADRVPR